MSAYSQNNIGSKVFQGEIIKIKMNNAPFPHKGRAEGYKYKDKFFPADIHYCDNTVLFYIPANYKQTGTTDLIIHFHGWWNSTDSTLKKYELAEQLEKSQKNAILVIPEGPKFAPDSFGGKLEEKDGFVKFINEALEKLFELKKIPNKNVGKIVLSGHSGAYRVMSYILMHGGMTDKIKEVYMFDALYGQMEKFIYWIDHYKGRYINIYTEEGGTKAQCISMMEDFTGWNIPYLSVNENELSTAQLKNNRVTFIYTPLAHDDVLNKNNEFYNYLVTSCLSDIAY
mgnify:CR=1 FL=1